MLCRDIPDETDCSNTGCPMSVPVIFSAGVVVESAMFKIIRCVDLDGGFIGKLEKCVCREIC